MGLHEVRYPSRLFPAKCGHVLTGQATKFKGRDDQYWAKPSLWPLLYSVCTVLAVEVEVLKQGSHEVEARKMIIGSRPPRCLNKCLNCKPCIAALVITSHHNKGSDTPHNRDNQGDDNYYLIAWKCKCGNKLFHP
ncbi:Epidermal patterning factor-like protein [Forsythia ovata]|uniref:Epidermal patterning factor-like protein n=1 Tax=Forsythia ovata TaxID=205694 RepID=A0ABD1WGT4_9LAMI